MSRCILLPAIGDPMLVKMWIAQYLKCANSHVDNLYVIVNSAYPQEIRNYSEKLFKEIGAVVVGNYPNMKTHGVILRELFENSTEDLVMLIEDDCFLFNRNEIDKCFRGIEKEEYDLAGSPRGSCTMELWDAAKTKWGLDYSGARDVGPNFWPNCLFVKRTDLLRTDLYFGEKEFKAGEYIASVDYTMKETGYGDTLVWMSLQLRGLGLRVKEIPQYHGSLQELSHYNKHQGLWDGYAPWTHTGSSSSAQSLLMDKMIPEANTYEEKLELERRLAWWVLAYRNYGNQFDINDEVDIRRYVDDCNSHCNNIILRCSLSNKNITTLVRGYESLL